MRHVTKSQINWSNNVKRQNEVADTATFLIGLVVFAAIALGSMFGADREFFISTLIGFVIAESVVFGLFGAAQLAFKIAGLQPVK